MSLVKDKVPVTVWLSTESRDGLKLLSKDLDISMSDLVRLIVSHYLKNADNIDIQLEMKKG